MKFQSQLTRTANALLACKIWNKNVKKLSWILRIFYFFLVENFGKIRPRSSRVDMMHNDEFWFGNIWFWKARYCFHQYIFYVLNTLGSVCRWHNRSGCWRETKYATFQGTENRRISSNSIHTNPRMRQILGMWTWGAIMIRIELSIIKMLWFPLSPQNLLNSCRLGSFACRLQLSFHSIIILKWQYSVSFSLEACASNLLIGWMMPLIKQFWMSNLQMVRSSLSVNACYLSITLSDIFHSCIVSYDKYIFCFCSNMILTYTP